MITFFSCLAILVFGYFTYGKFVERQIGPDDRVTPAVGMEDGVDFLVLPRWKLFMIQLLNIAGLGPIFGALAGAVWGPSVFLWITFGTIFAGGVHDYLSGMISERNKGASLAEISGYYLGGGVKNGMRVLSVVLLVMVGAVFSVGPAGLICMLGKNIGWSGMLVNAKFWTVVILLYYFVATLVSIDKIIGKLYPIFGVCLIAMAIGIGIGIFTHAEYQIPELWQNPINMHPKGVPIWSILFISVACGAISGFHATQSPLMARCMKNERQGKSVFFGAMVCEGIIALIWAAAGCSVYQISNGQTGELFQLISGSGQAKVIYDVCSKTMGGFGIALAMVGVIVCPITSGDTAFRSARLTLADWMKVSQSTFKSRIILCLPLLVIGGLITCVDYGVIWRYFSWCNQTLAVITLWAAAVYLAQNGKRWEIAAIPATFMSAVSATYLLQAKECFRLPQKIAYPGGIVVAVFFLLLFLCFLQKLRKGGKLCDLDKSSKDKVKQ